MEQTEKSLLEFPCDFPLKIFGLANDEFETIALTAIRKHVPDLAENALTTRLSQDKKYLAISVTLHITSREQLDSLYRELSGTPQVLMVL